MENLMIFLSLFILQRRGLIVYGFKKEIKTEESPTSTEESFKKSTTPQVTYHSKPSWTSGTKDFIKPTPFSGIDEWQRGIVNTVKSSITAKQAIIPQDVQNAERLIREKPEDKTSVEKNKIIGLSQIKIFVIGFTAGIFLTLVIVACVMCSCKRKHQSKVGVKIGMGVKSFQTFNNSNLNTEIV